MYRIVLFRIQSTNHPLVSFNHAAVERWTLFISLCVCNYVPRPTTVRPRKCQTSSHFAPFRRETWETTRRWDRGSRCTTSWRVPVKTQKRKRSLHTDLARQITATTNPVFLLHLTIVLSWTSFWTPRWHFWGYSTLLVKYYRIFVFYFSPISSM